jgi:hypothetical protein
MVVFISTTVPTTISIGVLLFAILDVVSKVVYGMMAVASDSKTIERDLAEAGRPAPLRKAA